MNQFGERTEFEEPRCWADEVPQEPRFRLASVTSVVVHRLFEGQPGVLGVRKSLTAASTDDFWKVRKAGLSLLMGMVGDAKPVACEPRGEVSGPAAGIHPDLASPRGRQTGARGKLGSNSDGGRARALSPERASPRCVSVPQRSSESGRPARCLRVDRSEQE